MSSRRIAVIPGDGIGPEVIDAGLGVLNRVNDARKLGLELVHFGWNADEYLRTGVSIPPGGMDDIRTTTRPSTSARSAIPASPT